VADDAEPSVRTLKPAPASHSSDVDRIGREADDQEEEDEAGPRRRMRDPGPLGVEEDAGARGRRDRKRNQKLRRAHRGHG